MKAEDMILLDNQLCFPLYVCAKEIVNVYTPILRDLDLTYTQYITMMVMWEEKKVLTRRLKERLYLDSGTLTPVLKKLEEKGLIKKERSTEDARDLEVRLTPKGEKLRTQALEVPGQVGGCLCDMEGAEELRTLLLRLMELMKQRRENR